jgi:UDP-glucose 4-epimerase
MDIIIGGAGFIGTNLARHLTDRRAEVVIIDNFSLGSSENLAGLELKAVHQLDVTDSDSLHRLLSQTVADCENSEVTLWHLAANSDILAGVEDKTVDLHNTFLTTVAVLSVMETLNLTKLNFASSSAVYGDQGFKAITEDCGNLLPLSNYGAMKLASEALISAAREKFLEDVSIFRFPNVVGLPATHGILYDFDRKLRKDNSILNVLGNGTQQKSYLHVDDLIMAMLRISDFTSSERLKIFNIGPTDDGITVKKIAQIFAQYYNCTNIKFGVEGRGWVGDIPKFRYNVEKILSIGWAPHHSSEQAIIRVIAELSS